MNNKPLLLAINILVTVLGMVTLGSIALPSLNITLSQAIGQESVMSNGNNTAAIDAVGSPLYNLTFGDKSYPIKFNITGGS